MAWLFGLAVECGASTSDADAVVATLGPLVSAGRTRVYTAGDGAAWAVLRPDVDADDEDLVARQAAFATGALARYDGAFRFGLAGVEVDEARTWEELVEDIDAGTILPDLILSSSAYEALGKPAGFEPFERHWRSMT